MLSGWGIGLATRRYPAGRQHRPKQKWMKRGPGSSTVSRGGGGGGDAIVAAQQFLGDRQRAEATVAAPPHTTPPHPRVGVKGCNLPGLLRRPVAGGHAPTPSTVEAAGFTPAWPGGTAGGACGMRGGGCGWARARSEERAKHVRCEEEAGNLQQQAQKEREKSCGQAA